ncbi:GmrSD restriction endonuclease domain-containing protein [Candidatus Palauibacter sp.]|uniref:DUF262 domain-containing protein n=1 Tax=Candidatus Palauibacter sp. TaxID=3101350 RepID=UPI003B02A1A3
MRSEPIEYQKRTVAKWLEALLDGSLALPRFQRSYVWTDRKIADLIMALLGGRPVGTMLLIDRYKNPVPPNVSIDALRHLERFAPRPISGVDSDLAECTELILDGQQRLTSLWRAIELGASAGLEDTERHEGHAFLEVHDISANSLEPLNVVFPARNAAASYLADPPEAASRNLVPFRLFDPRHADASTKDLQADPLMGWCSQVSHNDMNRGVGLWTRIEKQLRTPFLARNIWYAKLPRNMGRSAAIQVFVKVNESSAVIRKFDIAVAEFDKNATRKSLRQEISEWAEAVTHAENFFGSDEERMIPQVGELVLKVACLQEGKNPTDKHFTSRDVLKRLGDPGRLHAIFDGIEWTLEFLAEERIWRDKHLPSAVPLRVIPALFSRLRDIADASDMEGIARRCLRAYLWRAFITDRYARSANTRLRDDFVALQKLFDRLPKIGDPIGQMKRYVPVFSNAFPLPKRDALYDLDDPLAPPTRKDSLSRSLLVASLQKGAKDFGSGAAVSESNVGTREAHHLFPKGFLRSLKPAVTEPKQINHCLNYALVSGPTNRRIAAKAPLDYLRDRYRRDVSLMEEELRARIESHLIPYEALEVRERNSRNAYHQFLKKRAGLLEPAIRKLADGQTV